MPSLSIQICLAVPSLKNARQFVNSERSSMKIGGNISGAAVVAFLRRFFEIACVLMRLDHVTSFIVNANHSIM